MTHLSISGFLQNPISAEPIKGEVTSKGSPKKRVQFIMDDPKKLYLIAAGSFKECIPGITQPPKLAWYKKAHWTYIRFHDKTSGKAYFLEVNTNSLCKRLKLNKKEVNVYAKNHHHDVTEIVLKKMEQISPRQSEQSLDKPVEAPKVQVLPEVSDQTDTTLEENPVENNKIDEKPIETEEEAAAKIRAEISTYLDEIKKRGERITLLQKKIEQRAIESESQSKRLAELEKKLDNMDSPLPNNWRDFLICGTCIAVVAVSAIIGSQTKHWFN